MRISFVRHSLLNRGGDKMIVAYASHLAENGHDVILKSNLIDTVFELSPLVKVESLRFSGKIGTILSLFLKEKDADIIIVDIIPLTFLLSVRNMNRVLYFAQDYNENSYNNAIQKAIIRMLYTVSLKLFKVPVIAVSDELAQLFASKYGADAKVICNGVDLKVFYPDPSSGLIIQKGDNKAILFFSRRDHRKGFDLAVQSVEKLVNSYSFPVEVWTVGEHLNPGEVPCVIKNFGYVSENLLRQIMSSADLFLYPSRNEGFGLMVMEAFACKCPVVTTDAISFAIDRENSLVARIGDVSGLVANVVEILAKGELAHQLTDKASKFVLKYSLKSSANKFEAALQAQLEA